MNQNLGTALRHGNVRKVTAGGIGYFPSPEVLDQVLEPGSSSYLLKQDICHPVDQLSLVEVLQRHPPQVELVVTGHFLAVHGHGRAQ